MFINDYNLSMVIEVIGIKLTIDTKEDSKQEIEHAINVLKAALGHPSHSVAEPSYSQGSYAEPSYTESSSETPSEPAATPGLFSLFDDDSSQAFCLFQKEETVAL